MSLIDAIRAVKGQSELPPDDPEFEALRAAAHALQNRGITYRIVDGKVEVEDRPTEQDRIARLDIGSRRVRLGIVADIHGGSHYEQLSGLRTFYEYGDRVKVDAFINAGDWTQGSDKMHLDQPYQVHVHGADQQINYVAAIYPQSSRPEIKTFGISGNHDDSHLKDGGVNVLRRLADLRPDIVYLGQTASYFSIGPVNTYIVHPRGGKPYADSYRPQKFAEALPIDRSVHLLLMGHLHTYDAGLHHGMARLLLPCFQSRYGWLASGGLHPAIGGIIADLWMTKAGGIGRFKHEVVRFQAQSADWDHAASRAAVEIWTDDRKAQSR